MSGITKVRDNGSRPRKKAIVHKMDAFIPYFKTDASSVECVVLYYFAPFFFFSHPTVVLVGVSTFYTEVLFLLRDCHRGL